MVYDMKKCGTEDLDALRQISVRTFEDTFAHLNTREHMEAYLRKAFHPDQLRSELENPASQFWFLMEDGVPCGYLKLNEASAQTDIRHPDTLEIERIYLTRESLGKGLGTRLMQEALHLAACAGKTAVWLGVWQKNARAIAFYKKHGFRKIGQHTFHMGDDAQTDDLMERVL